MADLNRLYDALKQADAAGNKEDAQQLANYIRAELAAQPQEELVQPLVKPEETPFLTRAKESLKQGFQSFGEASEGRELARLKEEGKLPEAAAKMADIKDKAAQPQTPTLTPADIQRIAHEKGYFPASMQVPSFVVEQILKSGPEMAESLLAGYGVGLGTTALVGMTPAAPAAPLAGTIVGGLAGIGTYAYQQYGHFMDRQALAKNAPEELDPANAKKWAAITAPVGYFADKLTAGSLKFGEKVVERAVVDELAKRGVMQATKEVAKAGAKKGAAQAVAGISEMPTEMLEQWAERKQAGLATDTPEAWDEYWNAGWSALAMGTGVGAAVGSATGAANKYKELKSIDNTVNEVNEAPPAKERASRDTKIKSTWSTLEAKGDELRKLREEQTAAADKKAAEDEATAQAVAPEVITEAPVVEAPVVKRGRKPKVTAEAPVVEAPVTEEVAVEETPVNKGVLDEATLTSLGINKRSNAFKELLGVDVTTPEGLSFFDETLDNHTGKVDENAIGAFLRDIVPTVEETQNAARAKTKSATNRASVQTLSERGPDTTDGTTETVSGTVGTTGTNVGQPSRGTKSRLDSLNKLDIGETTVINGKVYRKTETGFELVEPTAPESAEVIKEEAPAEEPVVEEPLPIEKEGRALAKELRILDPDHPLIDDLTAFDVNEATLSLARQSIDELKAQKQAKAPTSEDELRALRDEQKAAETEQQGEEFADYVLGQRQTEAPESEASYLTESEADNKHRFETEDLESRYVETVNQLTAAQDKQATVLADLQSAQNELQADPSNSQLQDRVNTLDKLHDQLSTEIDHHISEIESINLDQEIVDQEHKRNSKRARMFEAEDYDRLIDSLVEDNVITRGQSRFFEALFKGNTQEALKAIVELPLTAAQLQILENGHPQQAFASGGKQLFKWYRVLAGELLKAKVIPNKLILSKHIYDERVAGDYTAETDAVRLDAGRFLQELDFGGYSEVVSTLLHEVMHSGTVNAMSKAMALKSILDNLEKTAQSYEQNQRDFVNSKGDITSAAEAAAIIRNTKEYKKAAAYFKTAEGIAAKNLFAIFDYLKENFPDFNSKNHYGATNPLEMISEAQMNPRFQEMLMATGLPENLMSAPEVKGRGFRNMWDLFTDAIRRILHLPNNVNNALSAVMANTAAVMRQDRTARTATRLEQYGRSKLYEKYKTEGNVIASRAQQKADDDLLRRTGTKPPRKAPPPTAAEQFKTSPVQTTKRLADKFRSYWASFDQAINNKILAAMRMRGVSQDVIAEAFHQLQVSQAVRADSMADSFLERGNITYDANLFKFLITESRQSMKAIRDKLDAIAKKKGIPKEKLYAYASAAFIAKRSRGLKNANARLQRRVIQLVAQGKKEQAKKLYQKQYKLVNMTQSEIDAGLEFFRRYPEFNRIFDTWNDVREKVLDFATEQGLMDEETRDSLLEVMDYVPFFRVEQLEANAGPKQHSNGLLDTVNTIRKMKGSHQEINDVFDNMERWIKYVIRKGIQNRAAQEKIKLYKQELPDDIKEIPKGKRSESGNTVSIWENGKLKRYEFQGIDGETMVHGFTGMEPVVIPMLRKWNKVANFLRLNIVLQPVFSVAQIPQDALNAWFSSGVKMPFMIPLQVMKEIAITPLGLSQARKRLRQTVTVGKHDFSREYERIDLMAEKEAKKYKTVDKLVKAIVSPLSMLAMASDNVIRQAVYAQTMLETNNESLAIHRAEEIINFRRHGYGQLVNIMRQSAPFVNANLQALHISVATMLGDNINPDTKLQARAKLINAGGQLMIAALIYAALMSDNDEYKKLDPSERDRFFIMPNGYKIPLRNDLFTFFFKVLPEHLFNRFVDESEDSTKMRKALKTSLTRALSVPGSLPSIVNPLIESYFNIDTVTGRPIVGQAQQGLEPELQFSPKRTSQAARLAGEEFGVSPLQIDHLLQRYFSATAGIISMLTNSIIADMRGEVLPTKTAKEQALEFPFVNMFVNKDHGARNMMDYYELQEVVDKAYKSYNKYKDFEYDKAQDFLNKDHNRDLVLMEKNMKNISDALANLRKYETKILLDKTGRWTPDTKKAELDRIEQERQDMLGFQEELNGRKERHIQQMRRRGGL